MSYLIGLGGYAFSGKDAFADVLVKHGWYKTYMSKWLRKSLEVLNPIIGQDMATYLRFSDVVNELGYEEAKKIPEVRRLLQALGTEVGRNLYDEDFWLDLCFRDVISEMHKGNDVVVTGIRYKNELEKIRSIGGKSVWVSRPGFAAVNEHSSDNSLVPQDFDYSFDNNGELNDLMSSVPRFVGYGMDIPTGPIKEQNSDTLFD